MTYTNNHCNMNKNTIKSLFVTRYQCSGKFCLERNMKFNKMAVNRNPKP